MGTNSTRLQNTQSYSLKLVLIADSWWDFQIFSLPKNMVWQYVYEVQLQSQAGTEKCHCIHKVLVTDKPVTQA